MYLLLNNNTEFVLDKLEQFIMVFSSKQEIIVQAYKL